MCVQGVDTHIGVVVVMMVVVCSLYVAGVLGLDR